MARKLRLFKDNVTLFIALGEFGKRRLVEAGFEEDRIVVLPNMVVVGGMPIDSSGDGYVAYVGRISPEKGIDTLLVAAGLLPEVPVRLAGVGPILAELAKRAPPNTRFLGYLDPEKMPTFYRNARFSVVPSIWFEPFGLVVTEAMSHGLPVIASRTGGIPEIVDDGITGFLFQPGDAEDLARKMRLLWENPDLCRQMGMAGREKAIREYNEDLYYRRLMAVYEKAIEINKQRQRRRAKP